jgi:lipopolysaccharide transport system permease protein
MSKEKNEWDWIISSKTSYLGASPSEMWSFRHLLAGLVKRNFLLRYQQTVLGPLWILFPPLFTLVIYIVVFDRFIGVSTGTMPSVLFYFSGIILWSLFSESLSGTAITYQENAKLFSKVYFPRIIMPLAIISTQFFNFFIQFILLLVLLTYYISFKELDFSVGLDLLWFPIAIFTIALLALGLGLIFSVLTAKYRDLGYVLNLSVRLLMFVTPVLYPIATVPENVQWLVQINPLTPLFEIFRFSLLGEGTFTLFQVGYSVFCAIVIFVISLLFFNKQGDKLIDVV